MILLCFLSIFRKCEVEGLDEMKRCDPSENAQHGKLVDAAKKLVDVLTAEDLPEVSNPVLQKHYDALEALALEEKEGEFVDDIKANDEEMCKVAEREIDGFLNLMELFGGLGATKKTAKRKRAGPDIGTGSASKKRKTQRVAAEEEGDGGLDWKALAQNDELKSLKMVDLKKYLKAHGLKTSGKKADLVERVSADVMG